MNEPKDPEAAKTVQTENIKAVVPAAICSPCCAVWPKFVPHFDWLKMVGDPSGKRMMPHITVDDVMWRVNHCPSCGADVRDVTISAKDLTSRDRLALVIKG